MFQKRLVNRESYEFLRCSSYKRVDNEINGLQIAINRTNNQCLYRKPTNNY